MRSAFAAVSLLLLAACRSAGPGSSVLRFEVDSSGGYPVVRSIGEAARWTATLQHTLGSEGSSAEFGRIRSVLLGPRGDLYVVDPSHKMLSHFDSAGRFVRQIGREGPGPGEYRNPYSIAWLEGRLALLDPGNVRITLYDSAGAWSASWPVQPITGAQLIRLYRTAPGFWAFGSRRAGDRSESVFIRYAAAGPQDTLAVLRPPEGFARGRVCNRPDRAITFFSVPFGPTVINVPAPGGLRALVTTSVYRIAFLDSRSDTVRVIEREAVAAPIGDVEWDSANAEWRKFQTEWPTASCDQGDFARPAAKPPLAHMFYDDIGRLWVELIAPEGPRYDVFDADGRLQATVAGLPPSEGVDPSVAGWRVAVAGQDSTGVPVVWVYRLSPSTLP